MDALWAADEPLRVRELLNLLNASADRPLAYNTVQTVAERLTRKNLLRRVQDGQAFRYTPTQSRDDFTVALMLDALTDSPDQGAILARLVESVPDADARRMLDALNARTADGHGSGGTGGGTGGPRASGGPDGSGDEARG
ncbi:BlaI/MecI/CopY family transcriptional regulator [Actinomadura logoneensis]|uniref:BlaI/MecI/CopY family transcriptional regulator n=2 Tax=Actinomadura logoneensis TaxID=2293572 RepID=A0A372JG20_9ACTN|nr:BlaI/MecI/CopY family transcriptional regulator [Actinomadura logoneensis]